MFNKPHHEKSDTAVLDRPAHENVENPDETEVKIPLGKKVTVKIVDANGLSKPSWSVLNGDVRLDVAPDRMSADIIADKAAGNSTVVVQGMAGGLTRVHRFKVIVPSNSIEHIKVSVGAPATVKADKKGDE